MPIYEFYCPACHAVFRFLARSTRTRKKPACPDCGRPRLARRPSTFAVATGRGPESAEGEPDLPPGVDERRLEGAMTEMAQQAENLGEDDPRGMARLMRRFYDRAGMPLGEGMQEAIRRMEAGEDPEKIEAEMGDVLEREDPLMAGAEGGLSGAGRRARRPVRIDPTLHEL